MRTLRQRSWEVAGFLKTAEKGRQVHKMVKKEPPGAASCQIDLESALSIIIYNYFFKYKNNAKRGKIIAFDSIHSLIFNVFSKFFKINKTEITHKYTNKIFYTVKKHNKYNKIFQQNS